MWPNSADPIQNMIVLELADSSADAYALRLLTLTCQHHESAELLSLLRAAGLALAVHGCQAGNF